MRKAECGSGKVRAEAMKVGMNRLWISDCGLEGKAQMAKGKANVDEIINVKGVNSIDF